MPSPAPTILQILPELISGGVERGTVEVAEALVNQGWRSLVASAGGPMVEKMLNRVGAEHITLPLAHKSPWQIWQNAGHLEQIIRTHKVDIVHARSRAPAWAGYLAARRTHTHFLTSFHGVYKQNNYFKRRYNEVMTYGEKVIAVSHFIARHMQEVYGTDPVKIRVVQRGADLRSFRRERISGHSIMKLAQQWMVPEGVPVILVPGRITRWKGQHVVIDALTKLPKTQDFFCLLVGEDSKHPEYRAELENMIVSYNLGGKVRLTGNCSNMADAYGLADVVLVPSIEPEAFGRIAIEAQAMGKPVIATNHGGACETVIDGVTGWLVPPGDAETLARFIAFVLTLSPEHRESLAQDAINHVHQHFSTEAMCRGEIDVYREIMGIEQSWSHAA